MEHSHEHTHTYTHSHEHDHTEGEEHIHTHSHTEGGEGMSDIEKTKALLGYMIDHNEHHAEELADMLPALQGEAQKKLSEAIGCFEAGNVQLREVLEFL